MTKHAQHRALAVAERLAAEWSGVCERIEIAGSLRRGAREVKDIELLATPKPYLDMFGEPGDEDELTATVASAMGNDELVWRRKDGNPVLDKPPHEQGLAVKWGRRFFPLVDKKTSIPIDLFVVRPPADFSWLYIIRTGPAEFSKRMVIRAKQYGLQARDGALWRAGDAEPLQFEDETAAFRELGMNYIEPSRR
jgi:DNA polymerase/3'-5' exonuclease PolX